MAKETEQWDEVELPDIVKGWEEGDSMEGVFEGFKTFEHDGKDFRVGVWDGPDGRKWSTAISGNLSSLITDDLVGKYTRLTMTGTKDVGKRDPMKVFKVQVRR